MLIRDRVATNLVSTYPRKDYPVIGTVQGRDVRLHDEEQV